MQVSLDSIFGYTESMAIKNEKYRYWIKDGLLFLYCDSNEYRIVKRNPKMPDFEIGIFFSGLTRSLINSDYNLRVYECKVAAWNMLAYTGQPLKTFDKTFLRDIPRSTFDKTKIAMPDRFARRAEHFYSEYRRVRQGVTALESGNIKLFGKLSLEKDSFFYCDKLIAYTTTSPCTILSRFAMFIHAGTSFSKILKHYYVCV